LEAPAFAGRQTAALRCLRDDTDAVWVSDWGANAILRFDPKTERFESFPLPDSYANVRQLAGRKGEVWGAESAADKLFMIKSE
jgi:virginiamycin B lyase